MPRLMALAALLVPVLLAGRAWAQDPCDGSRRSSEQLPPPDLTACRHGDSRGCVRIGDRYYEGRRVSANEGLAAMLYGLACDRGDAVGCFRFMTTLVASDIVSARTFEAQYERVRAELKQACAADDFEACARAADLELTGTSSPEDIQQAMALLRKACAANEPRGCFSLGRELSTGRFVAKDAAGALGAFTRSCAAGSMRGCRQEGLALIAHRGSGADSARALRAFARACALGSGPACEMLSGPGALCAATTSR